MSTAAWTPVDETAAKWTPVAESSPAAAQKGILDREIPLTSYGNATLSGVQSIGRGLRDAIKGTWDTLATPPQDNNEKAAGLLGPPGLALYRTLRGLGHTAEDATQLVGAIHDINKSPDPAGTYLKAAGETAGQGAGQAALALSGEAVKPILGTAGKVAEPIAEKFYKSALKPSTTLPISETSQMVKTGLEHAIPVSEKGLDEIASRVQDLNQKIKDVIATNPNAPINKFNVASRLSDTANKFANQVNPEADLNAISESGNEFIRNQPAQIPATDAQALKQGTYRALGSKAYGELKGATIEAQKSLARGIKEELAQQFPELQSFNAQESRLFDLQETLTRAVQRISNHQLLGLGTPMAGAAGAAITGSAKAGLVSGVMKAVLDDPVVKSRLAIALNRAGKGSTTFAQANAKIANLSAALSSVSGDRSPSDRTSEQPQQ